MNAGDHTREVVVCEARGRRRRGDGGFDDMGFHFKRVFISKGFSFQIAEIRQEFGLRNFAQVAYLFGGGVDFGAVVENG
jgi:hypothetical protein